MGDRRIRADEIPHTPTQCRAHLSLGGKSFPIVRPSCKSFKKNLAQVYEGIEDCLEVNVPESYVLKHPNGQVDSKTLLSIEGQVETVGEALSHIEIPLSLIPASHQESVRRVILKIRMQELLGRYEKRIKEQGAFVRAIDESPDCFLATSDEVNNARNLTAELLEESKKALQTLRAIDTEGRIRAREDRQKVLATGRSHNLLPYENLTDQERELLAFYVGGLFWRMRGGGLLDDPQGTQMTRHLFTLLPMRSLGLMAGGTIGRDAGTLIYFAVFKGWGMWMDMGRTKKLTEGDRYHDLVSMTNRGKYQVEEAAELLHKNGYDDTYLRMGGLQMGPCYDYSWEHLSAITIGADLKKPYSVFLEGPTSWGEFCAGAAISLGFVRSLLRGYDQSLVQYESETNRE